MARKPREARITVTVSRKTQDMIDEIVQSFKPEFVSRGEVIDMMAEYIASNTQLVIAVFGEYLEPEEEEVKKGRKKKE